MRGILIKAAGILVWTMFILGAVLFIFGTISAVMNIGDLKILGFLAAELLVVFLTAIVLATPVILKASQDILKQNSDE